MVAVTAVGKYNIFTDVMSDGITGAFTEAIQFQLAAHIHDALWTSHDNCNETL